MGCRVMQRPFYFAPAYRPEASGHEAAAEPGRLSREGSAAVGKDIRSIRSCT